MRFIVFFVALGATATDYQPPSRGFEQNVGQEDPAVQFTHAFRRFYRDSVEFVPGLRADFVGSDANVAVSGVDPDALPLHVYVSGDPSRWRRNVPHFRSIRYSGIYSGIDFEWNLLPDFAPGAPPIYPMLRIHVAAGASLRPVLFRLRQEQTPLDWSLFDRSLYVRSAGYFTFDIVAAYQREGESRLPAPARFVRAGEDSFGIALDSIDPGLPLVIEVGNAQRTYEAVRGVQPTLTGAVVSSSSGVTRFEGTRPVFMAVFPALVDLRPGPSDSITITASPLSRSVSMPIAASAPLPAAPGVALNEFQLDASWAARLDHEGRLVASTFLGSSLLAAAVDEDGAMYFANRTHVGKWTPGVSRFGFLKPMAGVGSLSARGDRLAFVVPRAGASEEARPTTGRAMLRGRRGNWDIYAGALDTTTGDLAMATYVPVYGTDFESAFMRPAVTTAPDGSLWIATNISIYASGSPSANTLVALRGDGSGIFYSAGLPAQPSLAITGGKVIVSLSARSGLETGPAAPLRDACGDSVYVRELSHCGDFLSGTYSKQHGSLIVFDPLGQAYAGPSPYSNSGVLERVETAAPLEPGIACMVHAASREIRGTLSSPMAPGGLYTIAGSGLGPLTAVTANGEVTRSLGGIEVRINGTPVPVYSVQQGLITFQLPDDVSRQAVLEVAAGGAVVARTEIIASADRDLGFFTADGSGAGLALAQNEDGSMNSFHNPARPGSVVALFGAGPMGPVPGLALSRPYSSFPVDMVEPDIRPATGTPPGVRRFDLRLPSASPDSIAGWIVIRPRGAGRLQRAVSVWIAP
ncbi:MAG: hypothetical protein R2729_09100 [Bryobacteraceae bacterium]